MKYPKCHCRGELAEYQWWLHLTDWTPSAATASVRSVAQCKSCGGRAGRVAPPHNRPTDEPRNHGPSTPRLFRTGAAYPDDWTIWWWWLIKARSVCKRFMWLQSNMLVKLLLRVCLLSLNEDIINEFQLNAESSSWEKRQNAFANITENAWSNKLPSGNFLKMCVYFYVFFEIIQL